MIAEWQYAPQNSSVVVAISIMGNHLRSLSCYGDGVVLDEALAHHKWRLQWASECQTISSHNLEYDCGNIICCVLSNPDQDNK